MNEHSGSKANQLDNQVADFVDRVLAGESLDELATQDMELQKYQRVIVLMGRVLEEKQPDQVIVEKIKNVVVAEWQKINYQEKAQSENQSRIIYPRSIWRSSRNLQRNFALGLVAVSFIVILVAYLFSPMFGTDLPGAADQGNISAYIIFLGVILFLISIWLLRRKNKQ